MRIVTDLIMDVATKNSRYVRVVESTRASQCQTFQPDVGRAVLPRWSSVLAILNALDGIAIRTKKLVFVGINVHSKRLEKLVKVCVTPSLFLAAPVNMVNLQCPMICKATPNAFSSHPFNNRGAELPFPFSSVSLVLLVVVFLALRSRCLAPNFKLGTMFFTIPPIRSLHLFWVVLSPDVVRFKFSFRVSRHLNSVAKSERLASIFSDIYNSHVHAKHINSFNLFFFWHFDGDVQKPFSVAEDQIRFTTRIGKQCPLLFTADKRHLGSTSESPDTHRRRNQIQRKDSGVVRNTAVLTKYALNFLVEFVGIRHFRVEQADNLRRQRELVSDLAIETLVKRKTTKLLHFPSQLREAVGGGICSLQSLAQGVRLFWRRLQFNLDSQFQLGQYTSNI